MILQDFSLAALLVFLGGSLLMNATSPLPRIVGCACLIGAGMIIVVAVRKGA
jgi:hypothetical protein